MYVCHYDVCCGIFSERISRNKKKIIHFFIGWLTHFLNNDVIAITLCLTELRKRRCDILQLCLKIRRIYWKVFRVMVFNVTFNNISVISWRSVLLVEEIGVHGEKPPSWQTLSHNVVSSTPRLSGIRTHNVRVIGTDCTGSY